ncbi:MAG: DUF1440 domain-containing protein [Actinomycetota bacterium]|nr:DUF1440 domain-containing protein [Actinomycetota bacterium]
MEAAARGIAPGVLGTALMTAWQELAAKLRASGDVGSEPRKPSEDPWEEASAPAKVAKRIGEGVFHKPVSPALIPLLTNVMHWGYGTGWGAGYELVAARRRRSPGLAAGVAFGSVVWVMSYVQLVPMGLYDPPWKTPPKELALDLSYHLVYGTGVAGVHRLLNAPPRRSR